MLDAILEILDSALNFLLVIAFFAFLLFMFTETSIVADSNVVTIGHGCISVKQMFVIERAHMCLFR